MLGGIRITTRCMTSTTLGTRTLGTLKPCSALSSYYRDASLQSGCGRHDLNRCSSRYSGGRSLSARASASGASSIIGGSGSGSSTAHIRRLLDEGLSTCEGITKEYLDHMRRVEPHVGSFMPASDDDSDTTWEEKCLEEARRMDERISQLSPEERARAFPLAGVPLAVKDNICTAGVATTAGSRILKNYVPSGDATVVKKLKEKGCIVVGKTLCDEFGMGSTTESSASHRTADNTEKKKPASTRNPWDTLLVPGGSSGGSAAAVSARQCAIALGTDTGGSVRQPASFCGVVGLKPTYGRISRFGLVAYASSLDCPGALGPTVEDCAIMLDALAGVDPMDASSASSPLPPAEGYHAAAVKTVQDMMDEGQGQEGLLKGMRIGVVAQTMADDGRLDSRVADVMASALDHLRSLGADVQMVDVPMFDLGLPAYYITAVSEASSNLSRYDGLRYGNRAAGSGSQTDLSLMEAISENRGELLGDEPLRRILMGTYTLSEGYGEALYKKAQVVRKKVQNEMLETLKSFDIILTPTAPTPAYRAEEALLDPLQMYLGDVMTVNVNLAGFPAISVPAGLVDDNGNKKKLPVGIQFIGAPFEEAKLLRVAHIFERTLDLPLVPEIAMP